MRKNRGVKPPQASHRPLFPVGRARTTGKACFRQQGSRICPRYARRLAGSLLAGPLPAGPLPVCLRTGATLSAAQARPGPEGEIFQEWKGRGRLASRRRAVHNAII